MLYESMPGLSAIPSGKRVSKESLNVWIYTPTYILSGYFSHLTQQRLLDLLNGVVIGGLYDEKEFLSIVGANIRSPDGVEATMQFVCLNKAQILFVREAETAEARGLGGKVVHKLFPAVEKIPVVVELHVPGYTLSGQMHCAKGQRLSDLLNEDKRFIPITNVDIIFPSGGSQSAAFVAVNKEQIICVQEL
jgi:hypothetical protein